MRRIRAFTATLAVCAALTGCGFHGVYSLPLPGAVANGAHTYTVGVQLADVLDLVPYSAVKVNGQKGGFASCVMSRMPTFPKFNGSKTIASWSMSMR